jgi:hypothetical protein
MKRTTVVSWVCSVGRDSGLWMVRVGTSCELTKCPHWWKLGYSGHRVMLYLVSWTGIP